MQSQPDNMPALADQHWPGSKPAKVAGMVVAAFFITLFAGIAIADGSLAVAITVPIALVAFALIGFVRFWRTSVQLTLDGDGILVIRNLLGTYRIPIAQILSIRTSRDGLRIEMIEGRTVTASALRSSSRRRGRPDQDLQAMAAIMGAVEAARSARPEIEAAVDAAAPLRARRMLRHMVGMVVLGPAIVIASFLLPHAETHLEWPLRWLGIASMPMSLISAYSLLRIRWPRDGKRRRAPRW